MNAKIIAAAIKNGNSIIKNHRHKEIRDILDRIIDYLPKEKLTTELLTENFSELKIIQDSKFTKDTSLEFMFLDGIEHFIPYEDEGFIDENGMFLTRNEAFSRVLETGQMKDNASSRFSSWYEDRELNSEMINF